MVVKRPIPEITMCDHPPNQKKQKLIDEDGDKRVGEPEASGRIVDDTVPIQTTTNSAVTVLTLLSDVIIFSGHRDGSICRWNMSDNQGTALNSPNPPPTHGQVPEWIITSACVNLTNHEIYGSEEKLGIAGLVVRQNQHHPSDNSSSLPTHSLYSWNHQREDMRIEINGIPQKVMIWNATTSERLSALMIDVGRCCHTKMFANPLISCLVFCKLLVDKNAVQSTPSSSSPKNASSNSDPARIEKVWTDAIIVALQATCDAPTIESNDDDSTSAEAKGTSLPPLPSQRAAVTPTGNIVPFLEQTRKRLSPWIATDGFVRALAVVGPTPSTSTTAFDEAMNESGYIVSITETTRSSIVPQQSQSTSVADSATVNNATEGEKGDVAPSSSGGQTKNITIWDTASPGSILHVFSLDQIGDRNLRDQRFDGNVYALTLSHCNHYLLLSMCMGTASTSSNSQSRRIVLQLPTAANKPSTKEPVDETFVVSIRGWYISSNRAIAASNRGDCIVSTTSQITTDKVSQSDGTINPEFITFHSFRDLISSFDHQATDDGALDISKLQSTMPVQIPFSVATHIDLTTIAIGESNLFLGYENGTIQAISEPCSNICKGSNEYLSCSTAPVGLRGVPCPHLSSSANNIQLQNKCTLM